KSDALLFVSSDVPLKLDTETAWITTAPPETPQCIGSEDPAATATPETTDDTAATVTPETTDDPAATAAPEGTDDPAATATPETTDDPAATATPVPVSGTTVAVLENIAVVYVQDLPAGSYEIHVRFAGRQKESPALTMYPYLLIPDARETYHAWLESENQDVSWKRDEQSL